ncbi:MAG: serine/threonine protein kinase [Symploca sp. SIO2G7]|nr:serine/threonine protein kinase [Symploca sp. SIO2G7]
MLNSQEILAQRYQLQQQLGRTAAGRQTWIATDLHSSEPVIVKLLAFAPQMQWEELKLFEREAQVLQSLNHPRIPCYRDYFSLDQQTGAGIPWFGLVQDYIPGASLQELLEQGKRFSEKQVQQIAKEMLNILVYLHELSPPVLHRDIKPSNLILGKDQQIYLVDFGAVQAQAAVTGVTFTVVGTSGYAPLEQFWGRAVASSDLYALGATLIHLLTGTPPAELPQKDSRIQFAHLVSIKPSLVHWIEQVTQIAVEKRFSSAQEALEALNSGKNRPTKSGKQPTLGNIPKPPGTYIQLSQSRGHLEIQIPAPGLRALLKPSHFFWICFLSFILWGLLLLIQDIVMSIINIVLPLASVIPAILFLVFLLALSAIVTTLLCKLVGETTKIEFSHQRFQIKRQTLFVNYSFEKGSTRNILSVFLLKNGDTYQVKIRSQNKTYNLGGALRTNESAWLIQQIQNWLYER